MNEEVNKQAEPEKTVEKYNQYVDAAGYSHFVTRDENGQMLADESFDKDGNTQSASYYKNGVLDSKTIYNEDGSRHSFFYEDDGSVRSEKLVSADGRSVSSIAHTGGMTTTELLDEQGRTAYTVSYYNDGGKLYPWNEHSYAYDADGKQIDDQVRSFGTDGEKGGKTSEELLASLQHKDEWMMQTFADRVSGRVTAEEAQKTAGVVNTVEEKQAEPVQEERKAEPAEEVKQAEPEQQAEQVAEADTYVNMITPASEEREEQQAEQVAESDAYVNMITPASEEQEEKQPDQVYDEDGRLSEQTLYNGLGRAYGSVSYVYSDDGSTSVYTYDIDGQQTGFDSYDAEGHRKFAADFSNGVQQNFVRFDDEGRPTNIELYNEGQPAISTSIQYDGDAVYKDVRSADGQLLRSETTRDGSMSIVDYVDQKARTFSFDTIGSMDSFTDYAIQDGKAVKVKDGKSNFLWEEKEARFYDSDGRITEGFIRDSDGVVTSYSFSKDGSYKESGPNGDKTHRAIRLFGKNVHTPQMPEFSENTADEIPLVVDGDNHPQLSEQELVCFRQGYNEIDKNKRTVRDYAEQALCIVNGSSRIELFAQSVDRLTEIDGIKREVPNREVLMSNRDTLKNAEERAAAEAQNNNGAEQSFANTQQNCGAEQTAADNRANDAGEQTAESVIANTVPEQTAENSDNQSDRTSENEDEEVYAAENGNEDEKAKGLGEDDLMKQGKNLQQWINYFGMEGSRAKPPYASPFESVTETRQGKTGAGLLDLKNGNRIVNNPKRIDLILMSSDGNRKEPTFAECMTLVRLGQQKGWTSIRLKGSPEFQKQMYLACRALGMPTKDFVPTEEMLKMGAEMEHAYNCKENVLPQTKEQQDGNEPERRVPTLIERCDDLDDRFHSLEKIRNKQPVRPKTKEDPYPDLANFDTIRKAEAQGIKPIESVLVNPPQAEGKDAASSNVLAENKETDKALAGLMKAENRRKAELCDAAQKAQRDEWRKQLTVIAEKEAAGTELTKDDKRVKTLANKYGIKADISEEAEETPSIPRKAFDEKIAEGLRKREIGTEARTALAASIVRRLAAERSAQLIDNEKARPLTAKEMVQTAQKEVNAFMANKPPVSEVLKEAGKNNGAAKSAEKKNSQRYSKKTGRDMPQDQQSSPQAQALKKRLQSMGR